jgi:F0F1-type ATP synthase assembly protein I
MTLPYILILVCALVIGVCLGIIYEWRSANAIREAVLRKAATQCETCQCRDEILALIGEKK